MSFIVNHPVVYRTACAASKDVTATHISNLCKENLKELVTALECSENEYVQAELLKWGQQKTGGKEMRVILLSNALKDIVISVGYME